MQPCFADIDAPACGPAEPPRFASDPSGAFRKPRGSLPEPSVGDTTADFADIFGKMLLVFGCIGTDICK